MRYIDFTKSSWKVLKVTGFIRFQIKPHVRVFVVETSYGAHLTRLSRNFHFRIKFLKKINFVRFWRVVSTFTKGRDRKKQIFLRFYAGYHVFSIMFKIAWEVLFYSKRKVRTISSRMSLIGALCDKNSLLWFSVKFFDFCKFSKFEKFSKIFFSKKIEKFSKFYREPQQRVFVAQSSYEAHSTGNCPHFAFGI